MRYARLNEIKKLDRIGGGESQSKTVYSSEGISPCLTALMGVKGNTMPYIIEITKVKNEDKIKRDKET